MPPPFAANALAAPLANTIFKSSTAKVVEFIVVVVPFTVKLPPTVTSPVVKIDETANAPSAPALKVVPPRSIVDPARNKSLNLLVDEPKL